MHSAMLGDVQFEKGEKPPDMLKAITKPLTKLVIQLDSKVGLKENQHFVHHMY